MNAMNLHANVVLEFLRIFKSYLITCRTTLTIVHFSAIFVVRHTKGENCMTEISVTEIKNMSIVNPVTKTIYCQYITKWYT